MRVFKRILGLFLIPACWAVCRALWALLLDLQEGPWSLWSWSFHGLWIGLALWLLCYTVMPRPMRTYVFAHELTHALWAWAMGARIKGIKVGRDGGHVKLSHTNFLITLAPYFFPFYTMLVITLHAVLSIFRDLSRYEPVWMGWVGLTWGFHLTFTIFALKQRQPDIRAHGHLFSYVIIFLFNVLGIYFWIIAIMEHPWHQAMADLGQSLSIVYRWIWIITIHQISRNL